MGDGKIAHMGGAMATQKLTTDLIHAAIEGFEVQKQRINAQIAELRQMLTGAAPEPAATPELPKKKKRRMSAAGRKAIAEAQKKRWAAAKKAATKKPAKKTATATAQA